MRFVLPETRPKLEIVSDEIREINSRVASSNLVSKNKQMCFWNPRIRCDIHSLVCTKIEDELNALCLSKFNPLKQGGYSLYHILEHYLFLKL